MNPSQTEQNVYPPPQDQPQEQMNANQKPVTKGDAVIPGGLACTVGLLLTPACGNSTKRVPTAQVQFPPQHQMNANQKKPMNKGDAVVPGFLMLVVGFCCTPHLRSYSLDMLP